MNLEEAYRIARLWEAGKMIAGHDPYETAVMLLLELDSAKEHISELEETVKFWKKSAYALQDELDDVAHGRPPPWKVDNR